jgi:uncharacterized protein
MARFEMAGAEMAWMSEMQPSSDSLFELGMIYSSGRDEGTDLVAAHKWFNLAAMRGNQEAAYHRQEVARELDPQALSAALRAAREWLSTH